MIDAGLDPRFEQAIHWLEQSEPGEAAECFEELFFEAVRDEIPFVRFFLQVAVGLHHIERGQRIGAAERLEEAVRMLPEVTNDRGWDLEAVVREIEPVIQELRTGRGYAHTLPKIVPRRRGGTS